MTGEVKTIIVKDLVDFGLEGTLEMRRPNRRKLNDLKNAMGKCTKLVQGPNGPEIQEANLGDMEICNILSCVYKAPFAISLKGYLDYADMLSQYGKDEEEAQLFEYLKETSEELKQDSPFADSPSAATANSE